MTDPILDSLRAALETRPDDIALRMALARRMQESGDLAGAMAEAAEVLRLDAGCQEARDFMLTALSAPPPAAPAAPSAPAAPAADAQPAAAPHEQPSATAPNPGPPPDLPASPSPATAQPPATAPPSEPAFSAPAQPPLPEEQPSAPEGQPTSGEFDWSAAEEQVSDLTGPRFADESGDDPGLQEAFDTERPAVRLADVGGMEAVKDRLEVSFLAPMRNPELRKLYGKSLRGGLLLYGPPGCGKTFLARAVAGEMGAHFIAAGLSEILDMYIGQSEKNLHELFAQVRRNAPCVLFLDEIDALGQKRSQTRNSAARGVVNQLLAELDSVGSENEGVFVLAATNQPWDVDAALRRPGRLDRTVLVLPPDAPARRAILAYHLRDRPVENIELSKLVAATERFSGADLAHLCETAAEKALISSARSGEARLMGMPDFEAALAEVRPSTAPWFSAARGVVMFANEGGAYDELAAWFRDHPND